MDWTSVYDEDGSEDLIIPLLMEKRPTATRLTRLASQLGHLKEIQEDEDFEEEEITEGHRLLDLLDHHHHIVSRYSLKEVYYLSINYILGVGCLGIPYAFARAGYILCASILLVVTIFSFMTVLWVAETGIRFEEEQKMKLTSSHNNKNNIHTATENSSLIDHQNRHQNEELQIDHIANRYEVIDLVEFYLGRFQKYLYQASLMGLMYIGLLAYSQVFCGAIAAVLWTSSSDDEKMAWVGIPQLIFGLMVIPLSCMELEEQVSIQAIMATARFVAIFAIVFGSLAALFLDDSYSNRTHPPYFATPDPENGTMSYTASFSGFGVAFSASLFSQLFQHSIPGLLRPLKDQPEKLPAVPKTMAASLLTTSGLYFLLGISAASYFGSNTRSSINLNFSNFYFGLDPTSMSGPALFVCKVVSGIVVVFPALDTISVFPLIANTLGNNLYSSAGGESLKKVARGLALFKSFIGGCSGESYDALCTNDRKEMLQTASKIALLFWRLVSAIPPLFASLYATDLSFSLLLAGVAGVNVAFFTPSLLQMHSQRRWTGKNVYTGWYSSSFWCYPVLIFASLSLGVVFLQIRDAIVQGL